LGVLIDPKTVLQTVREHFGLVVGVSGTLVVTKILAAQWAGTLLKFDGISKKLIGSLTIP
ncbi:MAG: hypothetical protein ACK5V5_00850, partial [Cyclobacteriaceae bacterium]